MKFAVFFKIRGVSRKDARSARLSLPTNLINPRHAGATSAQAPQAGHADLFGSMPFEATVRTSAEPHSSHHDPFGSAPFVAPLTDSQNLSTANVTAEDGSKETTKDLFGASPFMVRYM